MYVDEFVAAWCGVSRSTAVRALADLRKRDVFVVSAGSRRLVVVTRISTCRAMARNAHEMVIGPTAGGTAHEHAAGTRRRESGRAD